MCKSELSDQKEQFIPCDQGPSQTQASLDPFHSGHCQEAAEKPPQCFLKEKKSFPQQI